MCSNVHFTTSNNYKKCILSINGSTTVSSIRQQFFLFLLKLFSIKLFSEVLQVEEHDLNRLHPKRLL